MVSHLSWKADLEDIDFKGRGKGTISFPLVVDSSYSISYKYGMVDTQSRSGQSVRGIFFIDPGNIVRAFQFYPAEVGRNTDEILRTLQALQAHDEHQDIVLPVNWEPGDDFMKTHLDPEFLVASTLDTSFSQNYNTNLHYSFVPNRSTSLSADVSFGIYSDPSTTWQPNQYFDEGGNNLIRSVESTYNFGNHESKRASRRKSAIDAELNRISE